jgi:2-keto-3-deoxy-L-arabinonate dehydratase
MVPVVPVPFREDESIDPEGLAALCDFAARQQVGALCLFAFGSEFYRPPPTARRSPSSSAGARASGRPPTSSRGR